MEPSKVRPLHPSGQILSLSPELSRNLCILQSESSMESRWSCWSCESEEGAQEGAPGETVLSLGHDLTNGWLLMTRAGPLSPAPGTNAGHWRGPLQRVVTTTSEWWGSVFRVGLDVQPTLYDIPIFISSVDIPSGASNWGGDETHTNVC